MALSPLDKSLLEGELQEIYDAYIARKSKVEKAIESEVRARVASEQGDMLVKLSQVMHDYHRKGLPVARIRTAVRKYGNTEEFNKLWLAYQPEEDFTLAAGREKVAHYYFNEERTSIFWTHDAKGRPLDTPLEFDGIEPGADKWKAWATEDTKARAAETVGNLTKFIEETIDPVIDKEFN
jgi:hypothetical protein